VCLKFGVHIIYGKRIKDILNLIVYSKNWFEISHNLKQNFYTTQFGIDTIFFTIKLITASNSPYVGFRMVALEAYGVLHFKGIVDFLSL